MSNGYCGDLPDGLGCIGGKVDKELERDSKWQGSYLTFVCEFVFVFEFVFERDSRQVTPDLCHC